MREGDPKWRELQIIFNAMVAQGEKDPWEHVINIPSSDEEMEMLPAKNGQYQLMPFLDGIPVYDISSGENYEEVINGQMIQDISLIVVPNDDVVASPDTQFWKEVFEGSASDTGSEEYENDNGLMFFPTQDAMAGSRNLVDPEEFVRRSNITPEDVMTVETYLKTLTFIIEKVEGRLMLHRRTWERCRKDHGIEDKWFLLFRHQSSLRFKLSLFDPSACNIENEFINIDNEDESDVEQLSDAVRDNLHVDDGPKIFSVAIPHSSAYDYHMGRLDRLSIPAEVWTKYNLLRFTKAVLRVASNETDKWDVDLKWVSKHHKARRSDQGTFALKEGWVKFAKNNEITAQNTCHFEITEEEGSVVHMEVHIDRGFVGLQVGDRLFGMKFMLFIFRTCYVVVFCTLCTVFVI
ncbi:hypothetical protein BUALT_Bualt01G0202400 [Buddleja alternifolia]|uniref:TF-B3 domain-containing protein n=1 Tax=Buddleja alternifolia TaxID=168488 RepID=A0AAV6Y8N2_9LAMI|nr:hypothetical protein BUALT_Bualt01G0202400 [Buddleja alternifolia]